jgi:hypothetical protein
VFHRTTLNVGIAVALNTAHFVTAIDLFSPNANAVIDPGTSTSLVKYKLAPPAENPHAA